MPRQSTSSASVHSGSTARIRDDDRSTLRESSPPFKYPGADEEDSEERPSLSNDDYTAQRDSILREDGDEEDEDDFVYTGVDPGEPQAYDAQLADALGEDSGAVNDEQEEKEVEDEVHGGRTFRFADRMADDDLQSESTRNSPPPTQERSISPRQSRPPLVPASSRKSPSRSFLHPSVSRLRSITQQRIPTSHSVSTFNSVSRNGMSPSPSHFSEISRASSVSRTHSWSESSRSSKEQEAFRWTSLKIITDYMFLTSSQKASAVLGSSWGSPTAISANGLICIGTELGFTVVFDFRQQFKFICGSELSAKSLGAVTALALSYDHTFVAVGHASGHINLFDLARPQTPARSVPPTTLPAVSSGRKEGHLTATPVTSIGFVGLRHTAIVSADDSGLAFYHSLGKVLFVEANDVLRILGKYPEDAPESSPPSSAERDASAPSTLRRVPSATSDTTVTPASNGSVNDSSFFSKVVPRSPTAILAMAPLPLGTSPDPTDAYQLIALLTPIKLVIVGMKPTPRTWFRKHRELTVAEAVTPQIPQAGAQWQGHLAWFPSVVTDLNGDGSALGTGKPSNTEKVIDQSKSPSVPMLAYSWERKLRILEAREEVVQQMTEDTKVGGGKKKAVRVGQIGMKELVSWDASGPVMAVQWLNVQQLLVLTVERLEVYDIRSTSLVDWVRLEAASLVSYPSPRHYDASESRVSHSMRVYKGKVFLLGQRDVRVGTLLSWADRILLFVQEGNFLSAIDLTRSYYTGTEQGNQVGLPEDFTARRDMLGRKLRELMVASSSYAFSEDRMTDDTHNTPDGRGVDRTSLFEGLVTSCIRASLALGEFDFLYEDLYERYQSTGIESIFLTQAEPFIIDGSLRVVPTYVTQKLIAMHGERGEYEEAERVIWHIDPSQLDSHQAITLCHKFELYDALIYVYTRTLLDFVSPVVELLGLIRRVQQRRKQRTRQVDLHSGSESMESSDALIEGLVPNAYKMFPYLENVLSGLTYPSGEPLPPDSATQAKKDVYQFLFSGHSIFWPPGPGGTLVLTADEGGGPEPTYPYLRFLLHFDAEAFLHAIDIAFEDPYLNDTSQGVSRQAVVNVLLKIAADDTSGSSSLFLDDMTFIRIFIARNIPKYPQFIVITPSAQQDLLVGLAGDADQATREDRQLAAEFLLSAYIPHNRDELVGLFEGAGFYRILRSWYKQDRAWSSLLNTYLRDPEQRPDELFSSFDAILRAVQRSGKGLTPPDVRATAVDALPQLLANGVTVTAYLVDKYLSDAHPVALEQLGPKEGYRQFLYLRSLVEPSLIEDASEMTAVPTKRTISNNLDYASKIRYLSLLCHYEPDGIIRMIQTLPEGYLDSADIIHEVEEAGIFDVAVWLLDRDGRTRDAFEKLDTASKRVVIQLAAAVLSEDGAGPDACRQLLDKQTALVRMGIRLGRASSSERPLDTDAKAEDLWFQLLRSQVEMVQQLSAAINPSTQATTPASTHPEVLDTLRGLIQETFTILVSQSSSKELSFPRLFKRLVDSTAGSRSMSKGDYTEFRLILTGMLESYRFEGEFLTLSSHMIAQDLFDTVEHSVKARVKGWRPKKLFCAACLDPINGAPPEEATQGSSNGIRILRSGLVYHSKCSPRIPPAIR
ncbi:Vacuolar protein sorting-associated protein 8 [Tulasnella sp. JGI-2019a]|nr:Vacuolar protein sorting-associated protein 8 [Tulasnella sp. JGI-2019a]